MAQAVFAARNAVEIFNRLFILFGLVVCKTQLVVVIAGAAGILMVTLQKW